MFKPTQALQSAVDEQVACLDGGNFISISTRFLELLGDFSEHRGCEAVGLPPEEQEQLIEKCLAKIAEVKSRHPEVSKVLVVSDSGKFVKAAKERYDYVHVIPGKIEHIDIVGKEATGTHMKTFVDFLTISHAKKVYLLSTGGMYGSSNFAKIAAQIGGKPFERIFF